MAQNFQENVWSQYKCKAYKQYMYSIISIELNAEMSHFVPQLHGITHVGLLRDDTPLWKYMAGLMLGGRSLGTSWSLELFP